MTALLYTNEREMIKVRREGNIPTDWQGLLLQKSVISDICTSALICFIESRSLKVAVWGVLFTVSKSMVMPKATPISSVLA